MRFAILGVLAVVVVALSGASAKAQSSGSLGGYGAAPVYSNPGMGGSGSGAMVIPYGGMFEGFMPSRAGGGSVLAFRSRPSAAMGSARTSFSLAPLSGGMGMGRRKTGMTRGFGASGRMGVMPPSFGYPFRQPPSLVPSATAGAGMSM